MESGLQDESRTVRTDRDVFRTVQLPRDLPDNDERYLSRTDYHRTTRRVYG